MIHLRFCNWGYVIIVIISIRNQTSGFAVFGAAHSVTEKQTSQCVCLSSSSDPRGGVRSISKGRFPLTASCSLANHPVKCWNPRVVPVKQSCCPGLWFGQQSLVCAVPLHPLFCFFLMGKLQIPSTSVHLVMEINTRIYPYKYQLLLLDFNSVRFKVSIVYAKHAKKRMWVKARRF